MPNGRCPRSPDGSPSEHDPARGMVLTPGTAEAQVCRSSHRFSVGAGRGSADLVTGRHSGAATPRSALTADVKLARLRTPIRTDHDPEHARQHVQALRKRFQRDLPRPPAEYQRLDGNPARHVLALSAGPNCGDCPAATPGRGEAIGPARPKTLNEPDRAEANRGEANQAELGLADRLPVSAFAMALLPAVSC